jgi:preprotein translocase subunit SecE
MIQQAIQFLKDAFDELKRVTWLGRKEVIASTVVVIILIILIAIYVFIIDFVLSKVVAVVL